MGTYLVERYLPGISERALLAACSRVMAAAAATQAEGLTVQYLGSTFAPGDECCFCLFAGPSVAAIRQVNDRADFAFARIVPVIRILAERAPAGTRAVDARRE